MVAARDEELSTNLWKHAYEALKVRDSELITEYERQIASEIDHTVATPPTSGQGLIEGIVRKKLDDRETSQLVVHLGKEPIKVREQGEKIIKFILWSSSFISAAVIAQPYAALAWSGVSILLSVSKLQIYL